MIDVFCTEDVKRKNWPLMTYSKLLCEAVPVCLPKLCAKPFLFRLVLAHHCSAVSP